MKILFQTRYEKTYSFMVIGLLRHQAPIITNYNVDNIMMHNKMSPYERSSIFKSIVENMTK